MKIYIEYTYIYIYIPRITDDSHRDAGSNRNWIPSPSLLVEEPPNPYSPSFRLQACGAVQLRPFGGIFSVRSTAGSAPRGNHRPGRWHDCTACERNLLPAARFSPDSGPPIPSAPFKPAVGSLRRAAPMLQSAAAARARTRVCALLAARGGDPFRSILHRMRHPDVLVGYPCLEAGSRIPPARLLCHIEFLCDAELGVPPQGEACSCQPIDSEAPKLSRHPSIFFYIYKMLTSRTSRPHLQRAAAQPPRPVPGPRPAPAPPCNAGTVRGTSGPESADSPADRPR